MLSRKVGTVNKAINKFGKPVTFERRGLNAFGESESLTRVATVKAFYYKGGNQLNVTLDDQGELKTNRHEKLMVSITEESGRVREKDRLQINDVPYEVAEISNIYDLYLDMLLRRV